MSAKQRIRRERLRWLRPAVVFLLAALVTLGAKTFAGTAPDDDVPVVTDWEAFRAEKQREHAYSSEAIDEANATMYESKKLLHELFPDKYPPPGEYPQPDVYEPTEGEIRFFEKYGGGDARTPTKAARIIYPDTAIRLALLTVIAGFIILALRLKKSRKELAKMVASMRRLEKTTVEVAALRE